MILKFGTRRIFFSFFSWWKKTSRIHFAKNLLGGSGKILRGVLENFQKTSGKWDFRTKNTSNLKIFWEVQKFKGSSTTPRGIICRYAGIVKIYAGLGYLVCFRQLIFKPQHAGKDINCRFIAVHHFIIVSLRDQNHFIQNKTIVPTDINGWAKS